QNRVRNPKLPDVMEEEAVLEAGVVEQDGIQGSRELDRVAMDAQRVEAGHRILGLESVGKGGCGLAVRLLEESSLGASDPDEATQDAGVDEAPLRVGLG